jgi:hypothetical protein
MVLYSKDTREGQQLLRRTGKKEEEAAFQPTNTLLLSSPVLPRDYNYVRGRGQGRYKSGQVDELSPHRNSTEPHWGEKRNNKIPSYL